MSSNSSNKIPANSTHSTNYNWKQKFEVLSAEFNRDYYPAPAKYETTSKTQAKNPKKYIYIIVKNDKQKQRTRLERLTKLSGRMVVGFKGKSKSIWQALELRQKTRHLCSTNLFPYICISFSVSYNSYDIKNNINASKISSFFFFFFFSQVRKIKDFYCRFWYNIQITVPESLLCWMVMWRGEKRERGREFVDWRMW